jgi:hypothetical protein
MESEKEVNWKISERIQFTISGGESFSFYFTWSLVDWICERMESKLSFPPFKVSIQTPFLFPLFAIFSIFKVVFTHIAFFQVSNHFEQFAPK